MAVQALADLRSYELVQGAGTGAVRKRKASNAALKSRAAESQPHKQRI